MTAAQACILAIPKYIVFVKEHMTEEDYFRRLGYTQACACLAYGAVREGFVHRRYA